MPPARPPLASAPSVEVESIAGDLGEIDIDVDTDELDRETPAGEEPSPVTPVPDLGDDEDTEDEPVSVEPAEEAVAGAEATEPAPAAEPEIKKPGPPPPPPLKKRRRAPAAPSERLVAAALEPPPPEEPTKKPRVKPWWEELFTDDFGRGFAPLTDDQVRREVDFIEDSLGVAKGGVVLDLGCGIGQQAVELSGRGYSVVGYDLSVPQLAIAGEHAQQRGQKINFLQGDMRDMAFEETFDGIYCWNTTFGYFEEEKNIAVAQKVFGALRSGGNFLLDVVNRDFVAEHQPSSVWFEGDACVCMDDMMADFITSRLRVKRTMMLDDGRTMECPYSIRIYSLHELGKMLHDIGFRVVEASGHPSMPGVFFGATSPRIIILAQKP